MCAIVDFSKYATDQHISTYTNRFEKHRRFCSMFCPFALCSVNLYFLNKGMTWGWKDVTTSGHYYFLLRYWKTVHGLMKVYY